VPTVSGGSGYASGYLPCGGSFTIRLVNNAGTTLGSPVSGTLSGAGAVSTPWIACSGAIVHTFLYVNINGTGMSDTSGTKQC
jgi:hypothetical protein